MLRGRGGPEPSASDTYDVPQLGTQYLRPQKPRKRKMLGYSLLRLNSCILFRTVGPDLLDLFTEIIPVHTERIVDEIHGITVFTE